MNYLGRINFLVVFDGEKKHLKKIQDCTCVVESILTG